MGICIEIHCDLGGFRVETCVEQKDKQEHDIFFEGIKLKNVFEFDIIVLKFDPLTFG